MLLRGLRPQPLTESMTSPMRPTRHFPTYPCASNLTPPQSSTVLGEENCKNDDQHWIENHFHDELVFEHGPLLVCKTVAHSIRVPRNGGIKQTPQSQQADEREDDRQEYDAGEQHPLPPVLVVIHIPAEENVFPR